MTTDEQIARRLTEVAGFRPWDNWTHVICELRRGKVHFCCPHPSGDPAAYPLSYILNPRPELETKPDAH